jgi:hypothetical protein
MGKTVIPPHTLWQANLFSEWKRKRFLRFKHWCMALAKHFSGWFYFKSESGRAAALRLLALFQFLSPS